MGDEQERTRSLAYALWLYSIDEPYGEDESPPREPSPEMLNLFKTGLISEHCGDCTNEIHTCSRCMVDMAMHEAKWITEKIKEL